jgi:hypothetical protein
VYSAKLPFLTKREIKHFHEKQKVGNHDLSQHCRRYLKELYIQKRRINTNNKYP